MRKRILSGLLACAVCVGMLPVGAMAAETDSAPALAEAAIAGETSTVDAGGNLYLTLPNSMPLAGKDFSITTTEDVEFVATEENAANFGELYAYSGGSDSANLRFAIDLSSEAPGGVVDINFNTPEYSIDLTSEDGINWDGAFNANFNATVSALGEALNYSQAGLRAGTMEDADGNENEKWRIRANSDAVNTQLLIYKPDTTLYTVTYHFGGETYQWRLPAGADLVNAELPFGSNYEGWYTDSTYATKVDFTQNPKVSNNRDLYAKAVTPTPSDSFLEDLNADDKVVLESPEDWDEFVANASAVQPGQRIELGEDIDLGGKSYQAIQFEGDFNGNNHKIKNGTFTPNGSDCGMFAKIDDTQKIANLTLEDITASSLLTTNVGILAGQVYGGEGIRDKCLVQNVHVKDCTVTGRNAGGLVGFSFVNTIKYCSVENTTVTGLANAAGISGLTYSDIDSCYAKDINLISIQSRGRGGIAGKLLESGKITNCLYEYEKLYGEVDRGTENHNERITDSTSYIDLLMWAGSQTCWSFGEEDGEITIGYNLDVVTYRFPAEQ